MLKMNILCLEYNDIFLFLFKDDCIYIFYTCTDKVGEWPDNKEICTKLFQDCCAQFESEESKPETSTKLELDVIGKSNFYF